MLQQRNLNFNLYGWDTTVTENVNRWFGVDFDASGLYGMPKPNFLCSASSISNAFSCLTDSPVRPAIITKLHTFTFGPRFSSRRFGRVVPFAHVLVGVAHINGDINSSSIFTPIPTLLSEHTSRSNTALAVAPGAGLDLTVSHRIAIRLFEIDYLMTRFYNQRQDNGVGFGWGRFSVRKEITASIIAANTRFRVETRSPTYIPYGGLYLIPRFRVRGLSWQ